MANLQNAIERATDLLQRGKITTAQANVLIVHLAGIRVIRGRIPRDVRASLMEAVKNGEIGRVPKKGLKPEIFHHKNARWRALEEQDRIEREAIKKMKGIFA